MLDYVFHEQREQFSEHQHEKRTWTTHSVSWSNKRQKTIIQYNNTQASKQKLLLGLLLLIHLLLDVAIFQKCPPSSIYSSSDPNHFCNILDIVSPSSLRSTNDAFCLPCSPNEYPMCLPCYMTCPSPF